jgi:ribose transport system substrate-binding protein
MGKKCLSLLLAGSLLAVMMGCGKDTSAKLSEGEEQTEEKNREAEEEQKNQPKEQGVEIELPDQQKLKTDYTTVKGLELTAASHIAVVVKGKKSNYWKAVQTGMQQAINDLNEEAGFVDDDKIYMTFEAPEDESDAEGQINIVDAVLSENPQVLCLAAIDMGSCEAQLESAEENGIPVIILDSGVMTDELVYTVCKTDNREAGKEAARRLCQGMSESGEVLIVASQQKGESILERVQGFLDEVQGSHESVVVADVIYADHADDDRSVKERVQSVLEENPNIKGFFATDESMASEVLDIMEAEENAELLMVGFDSGSRQQEAIRNQEEYGTVCQNPYGMGYATITSAARAILGLENDKVIDAGYQWIDSTNIDLEENQKFLYE